MFLIDFQKKTRDQSKISKGMFSNPSVEGRFLENNAMENDTENEILFKNDVDHYFFT